MQRFERRSRKTKKVHADNDDNDNDDNDDNDDADDGHRVIARVTLTRWVWLKMNIMSMASLAQGSSILVAARLRHFERWRIVILHTNSHNNGLLGIIYNDIFYKKPGLRVTHYFMPRSGRTVIIFFFSICVIQISVYFLFTLNTVIYDYMST